MLIKSQYGHDIVLTSMRRRFNVMDVVWTSKRRRVLTGVVWYDDAINIKINIIDTINLLV